MITNPAFDVPEDETPVAECPYCDRPFRSERACGLHVGQLHDDACTDAEREAYEDALEAERDELFFFHMKVVGALALIWGGMGIVYMIVLGGAQA